ncbi:hypothetical protein [Erysipelothrix aquatica]|uniref:hypothetical protein n=1 Tax=Erysipelothrix aquatica TaxID=2683714 RepID=UPI001357CD74|nr:hypothetical protein [Erysipelothrix aquatica]
MNNRKERNFWYEAISELYRNDWDHTKDHAMVILGIHDPKSPILISILTSINHIEKNQKLIDADES